RVKEWAAATSLSVSDYVRRRTLGKPIAPRVDLAARNELNRIGVNLNQIARAANQAGQVELIAELKAVHAEVRAAVAALKLPAPEPPEIPHYPFRRIDDDG
ncbi:MobC family plasmid mobilization relaxosome protein, partial [Rubrivirga sp. S365]